MRTATEPTLAALRQLVSEHGSQRKAAAAVGVSNVAISDALRGRPVSYERENELRAAMGLEPLPSERTVIITDRQRVIAAPGHGKKRPYTRRFSVYVEADAQAGTIADFISAVGARTFNDAFWRLVAERPDLGSPAGD